MIKLLLAMAPTVLLVVYSQLVTKWRVQLLSESGDDSSDRFSRLIAYLSDPYILSAYVAALAGSMAWMFVVERYAISVAFPIYIGLTVLLVIVGGAFLFGEDLTVTRVAAIALIIAGVALGSRG